MSTSPRRAEARKRASARTLAVGLCTLAAGCTPPPVERRPIEMAPIGTVPILPRTVDEPDGGTTTTPNSGTPVGGLGAKDGGCTGAEFEPLADALRQCDSAAPRAGDVPSGMRDRLEVRVSASSPQVSPGGHLDLTVTLKNKSGELLPLYFPGDPPVFEVEALDTKGRRVDLPPGKPPKSAPLAPRSPKVARITLTPGGTARIRVSWEAVKTRWAPERKTGWGGRGYPRASAGPLGAGIYTLRMIVPIFGAFDKGQLDPPKISIEVGTP